MMMKVRSLSTLLIGLSVTLSTLIYPDTAYGADKDFTCAQLHGIWRTWSKASSGGVLPIIQWKRNTIPGWPPKKRCIFVSQRMQRLVDNGLLTYLVGGMVNNYPVICGVRLQGDTCNSRNLIITLELNDDPNEKIKQLLDIGGRARGGGLVANLRDAQEEVAADRENIRTAIPLATDSLVREGELTNDRGDGRLRGDLEAVGTVNAYADPSPEEESKEIIEIKIRGEVIKLYSDEPLTTDVNGQTYVNMDVYEQVLLQVEKPVSPLQLNPVD